MPTHGNDGIVKYNSGTATAITEIQSYSYEEAVETTDSGAMGDTYTDFLGGLKSWRGQLEVWWDPGDASQEALSVGAEVDVEFYPQGDAVSDVYRSGTALIENVSVATNKSGMVARTYTLLGKGALSQATVSA